MVILSLDASRRQQAGEQQPATTTPAGVALFELARWLVTQDVSAEWDTTIMMLLSHAAARGNADVMVYTNGGLECLAEDRTAAAADRNGHVTALQ